MVLRECLPRCQPDAALAGIAGVKSKANCAASLRARLLNLAKQQDAEFQQVLTRFALERFLYRLSASVDSERFVLKGALTFDLWFDLPHCSPVSIEAGAD